ncbi:MAG: hypothetical protein OQJ78_05795 [Ignavibacteriaceae bacterium]|nr:hypothetical protein [Ignavibacteriaceae bacterium]
MTKQKYYKLNKTLKSTKDSWDRWPVRSQIYRYTQILDREETLVNDVYREEGPEFQARFMFESEQERDKFIREMLVDLKFKVLFFLHILIERGDKDAIMFSLKELLQKGFVQDEIEKLDEGTLKELKNFFEKKTGS